MSEQLASRVVVIGASNVARSGSVVLRTAVAACKSPLDLLLASGHGRALSLTSRVLGRELPPVLGCELWDALEQRPRLPTTAVVTDIGNDLVLGATPEKVHRAVQLVVERLQPHVDQLVMTRLPLSSLQRMSPTTFRVLRTILFPKSRLTFEAALEGVDAIDASVVEVARAHHVALVEPEQNWYGMDPIHVLRKHQKQLWEKIFSATDNGAQRDEVIRRSLREELLLRTRVPSHRRLFGIQQSRTQPAFRLRDGSQVSLY